MKVILWLKLNKLLDVQKVFSLTFMNTKSITEKISKIAGRGISRTETNY